MCGRQSPEDERDAEEGRHQVHERHLVNLQLCRDRRAHPFQELGLGDAGDLDRRAEADPDGAGAKLDPVARVDGPAAVDGEGDDGNPGACRQHEGAALEGKERAVLGAGPLREDDHARTGGDALGRLVHALKRLPAVAAVKRDVPGPAHRGAEDRHPEELLLGDPGEQARDGAGQGEDVEVPLVVPHVDDRPLGRDHFQPLHFDPDPGRPEGAQAPDPGAGVTRPAGSVEQAADHGGEAA